MPIDESYTIRLGLRTKWGLGENMYRGPDDYADDFIGNLRKLTRAHLGKVTEYAQPDPKRYFPPNTDINDWLENEQAYPFPWQHIRTVVDGRLVDIDPSLVAPVAFPPVPPADPENPDDPNQPDPDVYSAEYVEGKWAYDPTEWVVIGKVETAQPAMAGRIVFAKVDNCFQYWDGTQWRIFARRAQRSFEVGAHYPKAFVGGRAFTYCAVDSFVIPPTFPGSTGKAEVKGQVTLQVRRNEDVIGSVMFPSDPNLRAVFSGSGGAFSPGDRLSVYTTANTRGMKNASFTIRGIYS